MRWRRSGDEKRAGKRVGDGGNGESRNEQNKKKGRWSKKDMGSIKRKWI